MRALSRLREDGGAPEIPPSQKILDKYNVLVQYGTGCPVMDAYHIRVSLAWGARGVIHFDPSWGARAEGLLDGAWSHQHDGTIITLENLRLLAPPRMRPTPEGLSLPKPKIIVEDGDRVATALPLLESSPVMFRDVQTTGVQCALGPVACGTAASVGRVVLAGPASAKDVAAVLNAVPPDRTVLLDGAFSRTASSCPAASTPAEPTRH